MRCIRGTLCLVFALAFCPPVAVWSGDTPQELLKQAQTLLADGKIADGLELVNKALEEDPKNLAGYLVRARVHEALDKHEEAVADYTKVIDLFGEALDKQKETIAPKLADAYNRRGMAQFKLGRIDESIKDFDKFLEMQPKFTPRHWQRGISYYYAGKFKEGKEQFEGYQTYDSNDVENAVWRYLCMVPLTGKKKARADLLKIGDDRRIPMRQIYDLFAGKLKPKDILAAAQAGQPTPEQLNNRSFYAHLYLGLYYESEGNAKKALEHLNIATDKHRIGHYMWDVARVHRDRLLHSKEKQAKGDS